MVLRTKQLTHKRRARRLTINRMLASRFLRFAPIRRVCISVGELGSGEGKCGGGGGTIREAGGAFGKLEAAREEKYFFELNEEQIKTLKHEVEEHEHPINVNRKRITEEEKLSLEAERQRRMIEVPE